MPPIYVLMKPSSGMCNMKCSYCFYTDTIQKRESTSLPFMTEATLEAILSKTIAFADSECTFAYQGGEPTLIGLDFYRKAIELQKKYNTKGIRISNVLQTNGYALDARWCTFFAENHFLIGLSIDGIRQSHDANRKSLHGDNTFFKCLDAAELMKQFHVNFNILTVVNRQTAPKVHKIYQFYQKKGFDYQQYIACLDPFLEEAGHMSYSLTPDLYGKFLCELFQMWSEDLSQHKQPYIRQFENYIRILSGLPPESCEQSGVCGLQNAIESDGSVYPCDFYMLDEYKLGNLNKDSFEEIYQARETIDFIKSSKECAAACRQCEYFFICRAGCQRHRLFDPEQGNYTNYFCPSYQMLFRKHLKTMQDIAHKVKVGEY